MPGCEQSDILSSPAQLAGAYSEVDAPGGRAATGRLSSVTPPQTLDQLGSGRDLSVVMLLSLLLLDLQSKSRAENTLGEHK